MPLPSDFAVIKTSVDCRRFCFNKISLSTATVFRTLHSGPCFVLRATRRATDVRWGQVKAERYKKLLLGVPKVGNTGWSDATAYFDRKTRSVTHAQAHGRLLHVCVVLRRYEQHDRFEDFDPSFGKKRNRVFCIMKIESSVCVDKSLTVF